MGQQSIRQEARRAAVDAQSKRRRERAVREKRLEGLAVRVLVAVRERDAAVARADRLAGQSLREMIEDEGLSVHEAVEWCGDEITTREATRCRATLWMTTWTPRGVTVGDDGRLGLDPLQEESLASPA